MDNQHNACASRIVTCLTDHEEEVGHSRRMYSGWWRNKVNVRPGYGLTSVLLFLFFSYLFHRALLADFIKETCREVPARDKFECVELHALCLADRVSRSWLHGDFEDPGLIDHDYLVRDISQPCTVRLWTGRHGISLTGKGLDRRRWTSTWHTPHSSRVSPYST